MKRLSLAIIAVLVVLALALFLLGDRAAQRALDAQLAPLLTRVLGLPVELAPITTHLLQLKASSARLVMGDPASPAVVAAGVEVGLSLTSLLRGKITLDYANAADLMVRPDRWPSSDAPPSQDFLFLDPWLPDTLQLETGRYVLEDGYSYPVRAALWERNPNGSAAVRWRQERPGKDLLIKGHLTSLQALLLLQPVTLNASLAPKGKANATLTATITVEPGTDTAYLLKAQLLAAGATAQITATSTEPWQLPAHSSTTIDALDPDKVASLMEGYNTPSGNNVTHPLDNALPELSLPAHSGHVTIEQIHLGKALSRNNQFDFALGEHGIGITSLTLQSPSATLNGELGITSGPMGWSVRADTVLQAREDKRRIAARPLGSRWLFNSGRAHFRGSGNTWGTLLYSLQGDVNATGHYRGDQDTPIKIEAVLDSEPGMFALNHLAVQLGDALLSGTTTLSGEGRRTLKVDLKGEHLDLDFLFAGDEPNSSAGLAVPEYLAFYPAIDLDWKIQVNDLSAPGLNVASVEAIVLRPEHGGSVQLNIQGRHKGSLNISLTGSTSAPLPHSFELAADFDRLDMPYLFDQPNLLHSRSSGQLVLNSTGDDINGIFQAMRGRADITVDVRPDNNWQRQAREAERLALSGDAQLTIDKGQVVGVQIDKLDIASTQQDMTGELSLMAGRSPWLIADLKSDKLNITALQSLLPKATDAAHETDLLDVMHSFGAARVSLAVDALTVGNTPLSGLHLQIDSSEDKVTIKQLDFLSSGSALESHGDITWQGDTASLSGSATLSNVNLDQFLIRNPQHEHTPVSGTLAFKSEGKKFEELAGNLSGHVDLAASKPEPNAAIKARRRLAMKAQRLPDGVELNISSLHWGESELVGSMRYHNTTPPLLDINIQQGNLSLRPWESAASADPTDATNDKQTISSSGIRSAARISADFVGAALLSPVRFLQGGQKTKPGKRFFSSEPLPVASLQSFNMKLKGRLAAIDSTLLSVGDIAINGTLQNGKLNLKASTGKLNGGSGSAKIVLDASAPLVTLALDSHFREIRGLEGGDTYPHSGFVSMTGRGQTQAQLAASANGLIYTELGRGPFDYANATLLTADLASNIMRTLIPGIENKKPALECGVVVGVFTDGVGTTPYGFAMRTTEANLLGALELDLVDEQMKMNFDSRSRDGVGLSVGNVFSNTIQIRGPLTDPRVVPRTSSLIWRGWAAFMTAGLSVVGESVLKRAMASSNPCKALSREIRKNLCPNNPLAASSSMVCPEQGQALTTDARSLSISSSHQPPLALPGPLNPTLLPVRPLNSGAAGP